MKKQIGRLLWFALSLAVASCHKKDKGGPLSEPDVYIAGNVYGDNVIIAQYWKNGEAIPLSPNISGHYEEALAMALDAEDVYVAGRERAFPNYIIKYWKNGVPVVLSSGTNVASVTDITVDKGDVYVSSVEHNDSGKIIFKLWKNGVAKVVPSGRVFDIAIDGTDVYLAGCEEFGPSGKNRYAAKYWKNDSAFRLTDTNGTAAAYSIAVHAGDVYVAGDEIGPLGYRVARYWKNGTPIDLSDGTTSAGLNKILVKGTDIYACGNESPAADNYIALYWRNGKRIDVSGGSRALTTKSMALSGSDVYILGHEVLSRAVKRGIYWKNGTSYVLVDTSADIRNVELNAIAVQ